MQVRHAVAIHRGGQADVEIQSKGCGHLIGEELAKGTPGRVGVADQFGFVPAQRDGVIAMSTTGGPGGRLGREHRRELGRVRHIVQRRGLIKDR